jgi:hypothetical protein
MTELLVVLALTRIPPISSVDLDRDGLEDGLEQRLLERFRPTFVLSEDECDEAPARFEPGAVHPIAVARDGTIYGQATPRAIRAVRADGGPADRLSRGHGKSAEAPRAKAEAGPDESGRVVELKYFHLWANDCGRAGHALDAEHVSALVIAAGAADDWRALFWYAGAHEDTVCDASSGARADTLRSRSVGPYVYVSRGKHASYLDPAHCAWGCGGDSCAFDRPLPLGPLINVGETNRPLNGATWIESKRWPLAAKLGSDFEPGTRARLDRAGGGVVGLMRHLQPTQAPLLAGDTAIDALHAAADATGTALDAAGGALVATGEALGSTASAVGSALKKTGSGVARFLRLK